jgi:hypothetical protein
VGQLHGLAEGAEDDGVLADVVADADGVVTEIQETNNARGLLIQVVPGS